MDLLRQHLPELKVRFVNVVDLMRLQDEKEHPHGLSGSEFDALFTTDKPIVFAYHGYPWLIHRLTYRRTNHANLHVRGYKEEGTTTTPFDMVMLNDLDRYHLVIDVIDRVPGLGPKAGHIRQLMVDKRMQARAYTRQEGEDAPEIRDWTWPAARWRAVASEPASRSAVEERRVVEDDLDERRAGHELLQLRLAVPGLRDARQDRATGRLVLHEDRAGRQVRHGAALEVEREARIVAQVREPGAAAGHAGDPGPAVEVEEDDLDAPRLAGLAARGRDVDDAAGAQGERDGVRSMVGVRSVMG